MPERQSILIIEDTIELVELLTRKFEDSYNVSHALDGEEGLAMAMRDMPDMVLLDLTLPGMNGFEVLKALKSSDATRAIPVLILTGVSDTGSVVAGFKMGADDYVVKPFNFAELSARISSHLTIRKLQKQLIDMEKLKALREVAVSFNHEINNPLTSISVFAHVLKGKVPQGCEECNKSADGIIEEVERIAEIVRRLSAATKYASVDYQPGVKMADFAGLNEEG